MKKFQKKIAQQSEHYTRLQEEILNRIREIHVIPIWVRDYALEAIQSAISHRGCNEECLIKTNRFTINVILPIHLMDDEVSSIYGVKIEYDSSLPDGEIDINGFKHQIWPRNLKFLDLLEMGD